MYKAIFYKEWLKIRWVVFGSIIMVIGFLSYVNLNVRQFFTMNDPINVWIFFIQQKALYYTVLKYIPVILAIVLALVQFFPEMTKNRYRLTFHLPFNETISLFLMVAVGLLVMLLISILYIIGLSITGTIYFPIELTTSSLITVTPWLLAGFITYLGMSSIVVDPSWKYRLVYMLLFAPFIQSLFLEKIYCQYTRSIGLYLLFSILYIPIIIFPGYRLRKGSRL